MDILLPVTFYFNPSTRLDNATNFWRLVIRDPAMHEWLHAVQDVADCTVFQSHSLILSRLT